MSYTRLISGIRQNIADRSESIAVKVGQHQLTYGELGRQADQISQHILAQLSTLNSQFSTLNSQLSTLNSQLSTLNSQLTPALQSVSIATNI